MTNADARARIDEIMTTRHDADNPLHDPDLRSLLMILHDYESARDAYYHPIPLTDAQRATILDELDNDDETNHSNYPAAFAPKSPERRAMHAELLELLITLSTDDISELRLADSLCPLHACDYAICFDDDDAECAQIRSIFPSHDT
jgi:hypothetical protein